MKKFLVVLSALLIATGAFAQDAKKADFNYSFFGIAYGVMGSQDKMEYDYSHIRVKPFFTVGNENVKGVVHLEIDQDYGKTNTEADSDLVPGVTQNDGADIGTDNKVVEVKWAYLQVKDFLIPNLTATMGLNAYYFPMVVDNDFAMTQLAYDFGMGKAIFSYIKIDEYKPEEKTATGDTKRDDAQAYAIDLPIKAGSINIRPGFLYITSGANAALGFDLDDDGTADLTTSKAKLYNAALNVNGDFGMVGLDLTGAYLWGNVTETTEGKIDVAAYAFDALLTVKPAEGISLGLFATYTSGRDSQDNGDKIKGYDMVMENYLGACDGRLFLIEAAGVASNGGYQPFDKTDTEAGLMVYGVSLEATFGKLALLAQYGYASVADDTTTGGDKFIGHEFDLKAAYTVAPATTFFVEGGYIKSGDIITDDAWEVAYGITTKI